jgi:putative DNA primase/helicase
MAPEPRDGFDPDEVLPWETADGGIDTTAATVGGALFVDKGRLLVETLFDAITTAVPLAAHPAGDLWLYRDGVFRADRQAVVWLVAKRLGDYFKPDHLRTFITYAVARLTDDEQIIGTTSTTHLVNVANGMLDPFTGELYEHDPKYLSIAQLPVPWMPDAACPSFDAWLAMVLPSAARRSRLLEDTGMVLDQRGHLQKKAIFLAGDTRTGKSTFARILESTVGTANRSAEEIGDLATNRFRAAELFGKMLNVASDIRAAHLHDLSVFKRMSGDDTISAERKFGHPFQFRFRGLFVWTMNTVPTTDDSSAAYLQRIRPYRFDVSFVGREDPAIEKIIVGSELPGVLVRLVAGLRRIEERGGYLDDDDARADAVWLARQSDPVRLFVAEATRKGGFTDRRGLYRGYDTWAKDLHRKVIGRLQFYAAMEGAGFPVVTVNGKRGFKLRLVDDWDDLATSPEDQP